MITHLNLAYRYEEAIIENRIMNPSSSSGNSEIFTCNCNPWPFLGLEYQLNWNLKYITVYFLPDTIVIVKVTCPR
jgi:hypothetical protein